MDNSATYFLLAGAFGLSIVFLLTRISARHSHRYKLPPAAQGLPLLGNCLELLWHSRSFDRLCVKLYRKYGPIFTVRVGSQKLFILGSRDVINDCLVTQAEKFMTRPAWAYNYAFGLDEVGIVYRNGEGWARARRFAVSALRDLDRLVGTPDCKIMQEYREFRTRVVTMDSQPFDPKPLLHEASINIKLSMCFGSRWEYDDQEFKHFMRLISHKVKDGIMFLNLFPDFLVKFVLSFNYAKRRIENFWITDKWVGDKMRELRNTEQKHDHSVVSAYADHQKNEPRKAITFRDAQRVIHELLLAGGDTIATMLHWVLLLLVKFPDIQQRCYNEICDVIPPDGDVTMADRPRLPYVRAVLSEAQRLRTISPFTISHVAAADTRLAGYDLPRGSVVLPALVLLNMDPQTYPEPEKFDPARFLDTDGQYRQSGQLWPYGVGPRVCPGEHVTRSEMFLFLVSLLREFRLEAARDSDVTLPGGDISIPRGTLGLLLTAPDYTLRAIPRE